MSDKNSADRFSVEETKARMDAALRGARIAGPQHKSSAKPKKSPTKGKRKK